MLAIIVLVGYGISRVRAGQAIRLSLTTYLAAYLHLVMLIAPGRAGHRIGRHRERGAEPGHRRGVHPRSPARWSTAFIRPHAWRSAGRPDRLKSVSPTEPCCLPSLAWRASSLFRWRWRARWTTRFNLTRVLSGPRARRGHRARIRAVLAHVDHPVGARSAQPRAAGGRQ